MKVIIAGDGKVGSRLTKQLTEEGYDVTLIDKNPRTLQASVDTYDVMAVNGNCASMDVLNDAGVKDADMLIAATGADELNLLSCITASGLNPSIHTIARIRNPEYTDQVHQMRNLFSLSHTFNPERQAAREIERLLEYPGFMKLDTFARGLVEIVELRIDKDSKLNNVPLVKLDSIVNCRILVCSVLRNGKAFAPSGNFVLEEGDRIFVTAPTSELSTLLNNLGFISKKVNRVMLVGGSRISHYLITLLLRNKINVYVIEKDLAKCEELAEKFPKATVIHGDGSNLTFLRNQGLTLCDALVALTNYDEMNMVISLYAKSSGVPLVITKVSNINTAELPKELNIGSIISPKELCCDNIVRYVRAVRNQAGAAVAIHDIADGQAEAIEFTVDESTLHVGEKLKDIRLKNNILISCISHGNRIEIPNGDSSFNVGDSIVIVTNGDSVLYQLNDIFA